MIGWVFVHLLRLLNAVLHRLGLDLVLEQP